MCWMNRRCFKRISHTTAFYFVYLWVPRAHIVSVWATASPLKQQCKTPWNFLSPSLFSVSPPVTSTWSSCKGCKKQWIFHSLSVLETDKNFFPKKNTKQKTLFLPFVFSFWKSTWTIKIKTVTVMNEWTPIILYYFIAQSLLIAYIK